MAFLAPTLSSPILILHSKYKPILIHHTSLSPPLSGRHAAPLFALPKQLEPPLPPPPPPPVGVAQVDQSPNTTTTHHNDDNNNQKNNFYVNLGLAVRTLREDMPLLFTKDLNYNIYRYYCFIY